MKKIAVNHINKKLAEQMSYIESTDEKYERKLRRAAEMIADEHSERPIILLSGPSGSGKTTSALKIDNMLDEMGIHTYTISMDDYFLPRGRFEELIDDNGKPDYESPLRIDIPMLSEHMEKMLNFEEVVLPKFDFAHQTSHKGELFKRGKDDIIVFEGIHALNPRVTGSAGDSARCMYVSTRTRIELSDGTLVHPSLIRLMRRLVRDEKFRGRAPAQTLDMYDSVQRGEQKYIMPYKMRAEQTIDDDGRKPFSIDTFISYEPGVYKTLLLDKLRRESETYEGFEKFGDMLRLLEEVDSVDLSLVKPTSLVREFTGGSKYLD